MSNDGTTHLTIDMYNTKLKHPHIADVSKLVWIVETFGIIRPASPIETKLWLENRAMTAEPTEDELQRVSQALLRVMANPKEGIAPQLLGYAAEMCAKLAARTPGQRLPTFSQKDGIEPEAV